MKKNDKKTALFTLGFLLVFQTVSYSSLDMGSPVENAPAGETQAPGVAPDDTPEMAPVEQQAPPASTDFLMTNPIVQPEPDKTAVQEMPAQEPTATTPPETTTPVTTPEDTNLPTAQDPANLADDSWNDSSFDIDGADEGDDAEVGEYIDIYNMDDMDTLLNTPPEEEGGSPSGTMLGDSARTESAKEIENEPAEVFAVNDDEEIKSMKEQITSMAKSLFETQVALENLISDVKKGRIYSDVARGFILQLQFENFQLADLNQRADKNKIAENNKKIAANNAIIADFSRITSSDGKARGKIVASLTKQLENIDKLRKEVIYYLNDTRLNTAAKRTFVQGLLDGRWKIGNARFKDYKDYADKLVKGFVKAKRG